MGSNTSVPACQALTSSRLRSGTVRLPRHGHRRHRLDLTAANTNQRDEIFTLRDNLPREKLTPIRIVGDLLVDGDMAGAIGISDEVTWLANN